MGPDNVFMATMDTSKMSAEQKEQVANVLQGLANNFKGWVHCQIAAMGMDPDQFDFPAPAKADQDEDDAPKIGKGKRKRKEKDPNKEKRAATPYNVFVKLTSDSWKAEHPDGSKPEGGIMAHASKFWPKSFMNQKSESYDKDKTDQALVDNQSAKADAAAPSTPDQQAAPAVASPAASTKKKNKKNKPDEEDADTEEAAAKKKKQRKEKKRQKEKKKAEAEAEESE